MTKSSRASVEIASNMKIGQRFRSRKTQMGPLVSREQFERVVVPSDAGVAAGAKRRAGGGKCRRRAGYFVQPTVFKNATSTWSDRARKKSFGPGRRGDAVSNHDSEIAWSANDSKLWVGGGIWTRDISKAHRLAKIGSSREKRCGLIVTSHLWTDWRLPVFGGLTTKSGWGPRNGTRGVGRKLFADKIRCVFRDSKRAPGGTGNRFEGTGDVRAFPPFDR